MSDPLITDASRALDGSSPADRDARIEQLLLVGLDHYFAAQYEHAINVWTRALFLDRTHARARAYIERARSALAEGQRESEELLHKGVAAFQRGESVEARRLLESALARGAPSDEARAVLDRLDRLGAASAVVTDRSARDAPRADRSGEGHERRTRSGAAIAAVAALLLLTVAAGAYASASWDRLRSRLFAGWARITGPGPTITSVGPVARETLLVPPRRGEMALARARALLAGGRLRDALAALDAVRPTDPQRPDAERLRADIQRQLLNLNQMRHAP